MKTIDTGLFSRQQGAPIPLLGVRVVGEIVGQGARITVSQRFRNEENQAIEAVYKFPLPEGAAVCGFTVEKEGARISGHVEERDKAFEIYDDALQEGKGGYLLDEERPNIFTLSVGNLNSKTEAVIHIEYVTLIDSDGHTLRFLLPTTITPRYIPDRHRDDSDIPLNDRIHPPFARSVPYGMDLHLTLSGEGAFTAIESPSHPIRIEHLPKERAAVSFAQESVQMDRDFILTLTLRDPGASRAFVCRDEKAASAFIYPGERLGPKILNLFGKMSEHGIEPAIAWGREQVDQTPAHPMIYTHTRTTLFARFEGAYAPGDPIQVTTDGEGLSRTWTVVCVPAVNTLFFPDTRQDDYWTSTTYDESRSSAWVIDFSYGSDGSLYKTSRSAYVRAVYGGLTTILYVSKTAGCGGKTPCYQSIQAALDDAEDGTIIKVGGGTYLESPRKNRAGKAIISGGWDSQYKTQISGTTRMRAPGAPKGSLTVQEMLITP